MAYVGVIGDRDSVLGFRALGMEVVPVEDGAAAAAALDAMLETDVAVIFLTEPLEPFVRDRIEALASAKTPAVILIPSAGKKTALGLEQLRASVRRATGMDLLKRTIEEGIN
jgi:V/A-type H+-transporting ATPase subunit F